MTDSLNTMNHPAFIPYRGFLVTRYEVLVNGEHDGYTFGTDRDDAWLNMPNCYDPDDSVHLVEAPSDGPPVCWAPRRRPSARS